MSADSIVQRYTTMCGASWREVADDLSDELFKEKTKMALLSGVWMVGVLYILLM